MRNSGNDSTRYLTKTQYQIPSPIIWTFNSFLYSSWWEFYSYYSVVVKVRHIYSFQEMFPACKNMKIILADIKLWPGDSREERRQTMTNVSGPDWLHCWFMVTKDLLETLGHFTLIYVLFSGGNWQIWTMRTFWCQTADKNLYEIVSLWSRHLMSPTQTQRHPATDHIWIACQLQINKQTGAAKL